MAHPSGDNFISAEDVADSEPLWFCKMKFPHRSQSGQTEFVHLEWRDYNLLKSVLDTGKTAVVLIEVITAVCGVAGGWGGNSCAVRRCCPSPAVPPPLLT